MASRFRLLATLLPVVAGGCTGSSPNPCAGVRPSEVSDQVVTDDSGAVHRAQAHRDPLTELSRLDGSTFVEILEVRATADRVFFCSGVKGLNIIDTTDPRRMRTDKRLGSSLGSQVYPRCQHLAVTSDQVAITNRGDEIQPESFIASFDLETGAERATYTADGHSFEGIAAANGHIFAAAHERGLVVLEEDGMSRVGGLTLEGDEDTGNAWAVAVHEGHAYVADADGAVVVIDVRDPQSPTQVSRLEVGGSPQSIEIDPSTHTAWLAAGSVGLVGVSIATPSAPRVLGTADTPGTALQVALDGGFAFVADWNDARVYDVGDPSRPSLVATERIAVKRGFPRVLGIGAHGGQAFLGEWTGLYAYQFEATAAPDLYAELRDIDFGNVASGETSSRALVLRNQGTAPLVAWDIATTDAAFSVDTRQLVLPPGTGEAVEVSYTSTDGATASACLAVRSDDPDDAPLSVTLTANQPELGVGDPAPAVTMQQVGGATWSLAEQRGKVVVLAYFATF